MRERTRPGMMAMLRRYSPTDLRFFRSSALQVEAYIADSVPCCRAILRGALQSSNVTRYSSRERGIGMAKMTPEQEARHALAHGLGRSGLSMAAQLAYDRLAAAGISAELVHADSP
jgi:hypothetical protein